MARSYGSNGSAAYNIDRENTARPIVQPKRLPDAPVRFPPKQKKKAKLAVAPLTVLGMAAVAVMLFLSVYSYARLYEAKTQVSQQQETKAALLNEQKDLLLRYENAIDLEAVAERAEELGMGLPTAGQIIYVDLEEAAAPEEDANSFGKIFDSFISQLGEAVEYFS